MLALSVHSIFIPIFRTTACLTALLEDLPAMGLCWWSRETIQPIHMNPHLGLQAVHP